MTVQLAQQPVFQAFGPDGRFLVGGQLFTYVAGTSTPQATYIDSTQTTSNTNPVILNAMGQANVWLVTGQTYKFVLQDSAGNPLWTVDQIPGGIVLSQQQLGQILYPQTTSELAAGVVPTNYWIPPGNILRYGAVSGINCTAAVSAAGTSNLQVIFPAGAWPMASIPTVNTDVVLAAQPGSSFSGPGASNYSLNTAASYQFNIVEGDVITGPAFRDVMRIAHTYGGSAMQGGRNSFEVQASIVATSSASNTNRNYTAGAFQMNCVANDTGTNPTSSATSAGAGFGINAVCVLSNGATAWLNTTCAEFNIACQAGSSVWARTGIQIAELPSSAVQGAIFDGAVTVTRQTGAIGWQNGLLFCSSSGSHPLTATGQLIATQGAYTTLNGVNLTSYTFTGVAFASSGFAVQGTGTEIDVGLGSSFHQTLHHTSGASGYDTRIVSQSGTGATGAGTLVFNSGALGFFGASSGGGLATGYGTPTGGARQPSFAAGAITLPNLAACVAQLILDFKTYTLLAT